METTPTPKKDNLQLEEGAGKATATVSLEEPKFGDPVKNLEPTDTNARLQAPSSSGNVSHLPNAKAIDGRVSVSELRTEGEKKLTEIASKKDDYQKTTRELLGRQDELKARKDSAVRDLNQFGGAHQEDLDKLQQFKIKSQEETAARHKTKKEEKGLFKKVASTVVKKGDQLLGITEGKIEELKSLNEVQRAMKTKMDQIKELKSDIESHKTAGEQSLHAKERELGALQKDLDTIVTQLAEHSLESGELTGPKDELNELVVQKMLILASQSPEKKAQLDKVVSKLADHQLTEAKLPSKGGQGVNALNQMIMANMAQKCCNGEHGGFMSPISSSADEAGSGGVYKIGVTNAEGKQIPLMTFKHTIQEPGMQQGRINYNPEEIEVLNKSFPIGQSPLREAVIGSGIMTPRQAVYTTLTHPLFKPNEGLVDPNKPKAEVGEGVLSDFVDSKGPMQKYSEKLFLLNKVISAVKTQHKLLDSQMDDPRIQEAIVKFKAENGWDAKFEEFCQKAGIETKGAISPMPYQQKMFTEDKVDLESLQKIVVQDLLYVNCDSNVGNVLLVPQPNGKFKLEPIDLGQSIPLSWDVNVNTPFWNKVPQLNKPLTPAMKQEILNFDVEKEAERIKNEFKAKGVVISEEALDIFRASAYYLKAGVEKDIPLSVISKALLDLTDPLKILYDASKKEGGWEGFKAKAQEQQAKAQEKMKAQEEAAKKKANEKTAK